MSQESTWKMLSEALSQPTQEHMQYKYVTIISYPYGLFILYMCYAEILNLSLS